MKWSEYLDKISRYEQIVYCLFLGNSKAFDFKLIIYFIRFLMEKMT